MSRQRLILTALFVAVLGIVANSGDADARHRCRQSGRSSSGGWGSGWQQNTYNSGSANNASGTYYGNQNAYTSGGTKNSGTTPGMVNGTGLQSDGSYSVSKPTYADPANPATQIPTGTQLQAPNAAQINNPASRVNAVPNTQPLSSRPANTPNSNPSPDADNSARNLTTSPIPGASPTKAPAPPAAAVP